MLDLEQFKDFTPGPWRVGKRFHDQTAIYSAIEQIKIAVVEDWIGPKVEEESIANSDLIAAAPELLAECKRLRAENQQLTELNQILQNNHQADGPLLPI